MSSGAVTDLTESVDPDLNHAAFYDGEAWCGVSCSWVGLAVNIRAGPNCQSQSCLSGNLQMLVVDSDFGQFEIMTLRTPVRLHGLFVWGC